MASYVLQGLLLGPLKYTNNLDVNVEGGRIRKFVNDTKIDRVVDCEEDGLCRV